MIIHKLNHDTFNIHKDRDNDNYSKLLDEKFKKQINNVRDKVINDLLDKYQKPTLETDEEKVIRILKKDFELKHGMTFDKFIEIYQKILSESPEKLI